MGDADTDPSPKRKRGGRDVEKTPWHISQVPKFIAKLAQAQISLEDLTQGVELIKKVADCLDSLQMPLPPFQLFKENFNQKSPSPESAPVLEFVNVLQKLRNVSVTLLNKKVGPIQENKNLTNNNNPNKRVPSTPSVIHPIRGNSHNSDRFSNEVCYICKKLLSSEPNNFNSWMCSRCGEFNLSKRHQSSDLSGMIALVTGARVKIGFQVALKLLRAGAEKVVITTRFPVDALSRFEEEEDYSKWKGRLHIYALDLRFLQHVKNFCEYFEKTYSRLDILIQNAAQTIRRPAVFYKHLLEAEAQYAQQPGREGHNHEVIQCWNKNLKVQNHPVTISAIEPPRIEGHQGQGQSTNHAPPVTPRDTHLSQLLVHSEDFNYAGNVGMAKRDFPLGKMDEDEQQLDLRRENSWTMRLDQVETSEMVEVALVNYMAPYTILQKLTPLMKQGRCVETPSAKLGWIVLVSAMEGKFMDCYKSRNHPHTNAAKAALNMLVRTCGTEYRAMGLLLSAVDTGWVTEEHPLGYQQPGLSPPLDCVDGAARVLDPVFSAINEGVELYGRFIKDYVPTSW